MPFSYFFFFLAFLFLSTLHFCLCIFFIPCICFLSFVYLFFPFFLLSALKKVQEITVSNLKLHLLWWSSFLPFLLFAQHCFHCFSFYELHFVISYSNWWDRYIDCKNDWYKVDHEQKKEMTIKEMSEEGQIIIYCNVCLKIQKRVFKNTKMCMCIYSCHFSWVYIKECKILHSLEWISCMCTQKVLGFKFICKLH